MSIAEYFLDAMIRSYNHFNIENDLRFEDSRVCETQELTERMRKLLAIKAAFTPNFKGLA
jgi:hypothetical protein